MVKRVILGRSGEEKIVDLIKAIDDKASAGHTRPAGTTVLEWDEDMIWTRPDGTEHSVRDVDAELEGAQDRINDAEQSLADSQVRLDEAEQAVASTAEDLTRVETVVIPAAEARLQAADAAARQELATLDDKLVTAQQDLEAVGENIGQLETDLATESDARQQLAQDVQGTFTELDTRLGSFATDEALAPIRQALTNAQNAVETAQGVAQAANQAANAASQAALEAAGIAASKGRVIIQETEPVGEDRNAANIWIKPIPDDPATEIEEKAITYVYLEGSDEWVPTSSDELAQAAQNALDAREAAQQAQQRADTAISNAAAAQSAAEAAQRTADQATTDAREAWNGAVAARDRVDAAIESGASLIINGSFENGDTGWPKDGSHAGRSRIIEDPNAHTGTHVLEITPTTANTYPETDNIAVTGGQEVYVRGWIKHLGGDGSLVRLLGRTLDAGGSSTGTPTIAGANPQTFTEGEWTLLEGDYTVPEGTRYMRFAFHANGPSTSVYHADDLQVIDVTEARKAQRAADEALAEASEAKGLAEEAVREVGDTVRNTVIEYAVNTSETSAPTSGWSTSTPTRTPGSFVWMRTIVTYADGDTSTTSPALLTGNAGAKGDKGATGAKGDKGATGSTGPQGVSVSSVDPFFRTVSRSSGAPAKPSGMTPSGWVTTEPAWSPDTKLYRAERIAYSNGTVSWTVPTLVAAYEGIVQVQTSVNGKNSITRSTSNASGSGVVAGDAWYKVDSNGDTMAMWIWDGSKWVASKVRNEMIDTIDVNKLKVHGEATMDSAVIDKVWADGIAAKTAAFNQLTIAPGNIFPDPYFQEVEAWAGTGASSRPDAEMPNGRALVIDASTSGQAGSYDKSASAQVVNIEPGAEYRLRATVRFGGTSGLQSVSAYIRGKNADGGNTITSASIARTSNVSYKYGTVDITVKAPSSLWGLATVGFYTPSSATSGSVSIGGVEMVRKAGAVLIEDGAVSADHVNAESVAGAVGSFVEAEVGNLKATKGTVGEAVINKLWADGIAAKAITASRVVVAPGNLIPGMAEIGAGKRPDPDPFSGWSLNAGGYVYTTGSKTLNIEAPISVEAGRKYKLTFDVNGSVANTRYYIQVMGANADGSTGGTNPGIEGSTSTYIANNVLVGTANTWHAQEIEWTPASSGYAILRFYTNHGNGASTSTTHQRFRRFSLSPMAGATLIENGAVTTNKLTVTSDMSAAIVKAMSVSTKKLVVTKEAILNHATLIGQTVVDDINVNGKLIGTNGVFTGTVDFANVNVTGTQIVNKLGANSISADKISGGSFAGNSFTGGTFVGGVFSTDARPSTNGGVHISPDRGIRVWNSSGVQTVDISPSTGLVKISDRLISSDYTNNSGVVIFPRTSTGQGGIWFTDNGSGGTNQAAIWRSSYNAGRNPLNIRGAHGAGVVIQGDGLSVQSGFVDAPGVVSSGTITGTRLMTTNPPTTSSAANVRAQAGTGLLYVKTSSRRYKKNIVNWSPSADAVLALQPRQWQHDDPNFPEEIDESWHVGFVAEEVHDLGLKGLVEYAGDGAGGWRPQSLNYERFSAAQQVVLKKHEAEIKELRERIALLEAQIGTQ